MTARTGHRAAPVTAERVLEITRDLTAELRPRAKPVDVGLDSSLERDLAFDSLTRVELLARIERDLGVHLPAHTLETIETPRDLLRAAQLAAPAPAGRPASVVAPATAGEVDVPAQATTLLEMLEWHAERRPDHPHVRLLLNDDEQVLTCAQLHERARSVAGALAARGIKAGDTVAIMLPTCLEYFTCFYGTLCAGAIPVPIYPPARIAQLEEHVRRHARILENARAAMLITVPQARTVARLLRAAAGVGAVVTAEELAEGAGETSMPRVRGQDIAFLQYTSGSTGNPKGVILTHANLLANIRIMGNEVRAGGSDVFVSWLPLYHDMGLIGAWLATLYFGIPLVLMSPLEFLTHPARWLWAIHRYRGTISAAPNFAYELCLNRLRDEDLEGLDLGSLRLLFNGAEAVSPRTLRRFTERFARHGLRQEAVAPVYGLAECSLGLSFPPLDRAPRIDRIARDPFLRDGRAAPARADDATVLEFVGCGRPLPEYHVRVVDDLGREVDEREEGRLEFQGPSATSGYFRNAEATRALFHGEWLDSGDRAYLADGELFITGRVKDIIIRAGRNIHPHEVEEAIGSLPGVRKGCVAVFGARDAAGGTERLIVLAETRETDAGALERLRRAVNAAVRERADTVPDDVVLAPPHTVLKTSSGKIRRAASRELYERGQLAPARFRLWQFARLAALAAAPELRRGWRTALGLLYALYAWALFVLLAPPTWLAVSALGRPRLGRAVAGAAARLLLRLAGLTPRVDGAENLPAGSFIAVANHASYLDGLVLAATLPGHFAYVAKRELADSLVSRLFLRGFGAEYVERFEHRRAVEDAGKLAQEIRAGRALLFFPEGTFTRRAGLLPFRLGAFLAAAEAGAPVVPVALRGTRTLLRADNWLPRRTALRVTVGKPIQPREAGFNAAVKLREAARAAILAHCGEPDLS
jgi:1-acyl-sn-glycerol-3-phosphate acyltransferase